MDQVLLPDQILHPRYSIRKPGQGLWLTANRKILEELSNSRESPLTWETPSPFLPF
ncbi:hypothetical protein IE53DRAFT_390877 [Violaceomyces palustris]|uniref:Uncharacterized protein n=1 Tax=Violaceomyces palustris TaxID=1673888 RepID=A0ACD0NMI0_9BASI|nr:hypothetical protein IE53DRAFT_390877 [Violaceomyces palustris]